MSKSTNIQHVSLFKKVFAFVVIVLFIGVSSSPSFGAGIVEKSCMSTSDGNILYVGGSGLGNYTRIQDAIDNASDGDTVFVYNGTYYENIHVYEHGEFITLIGENKSITIIDGQRVGPVITIGSNLNIKGFTIQNSTRDGDWNAGMYVEVGSLISDNIIINNGYGIRLYYTFGHTISDNIIEENEYDGIDIFGSHEITVKDNCIRNNKGSGISASPSTSNIVINNIIDNNSNGIISLGGSYWDISYNIISNNTVGINLRPFLWIYSFGSSIIANEISNNGMGIVICRSYNNLILTNNFIDNTENAYFNSFSFFNTWDGNYWDGPQEPPCVIKGKLFFFLIPWLNFDWHPAQEPYEI